MDITSQKTGVSFWKVVGLTVATMVVLSLLSFAYRYGMQTRPGYLSYSMISAQSVIWSWSSLVMGIVMTFRLGRKWLELLWGVIAFVLCLFPWTLWVGVAYFGWCYWKLEKKKVSG
jgi:hypothetical protein